MREKEAEKGSITIYMTLILSVLLSLFFTLIEGARQNAVSLQAECAFDLAVYSVFAEYSRELEKQYDLLFVDTSYGESSGSRERVKNHFAYYLNENLSSAEHKGIRTVDFTQTFLETNEIEKLAYATDENGSLFERQAVLYMEQKYGIAYLKDLQKELEKADELELFTRDITAEREQNQRIIDETEIPGKETGETDENGDPVLEEGKLENPADQVNGSRPKGILYLVTEADEGLSERAIRSENYISKRGVKQTGCGLMERKGVGAAQTLLFDQYIMEHCGNYTRPKEEGALAYQAEYILGEKDCDIDNLKYVVNRLLLIRETANMAYLFTDAAKLAEAEALAAAVTSAAGVPILLEPVKLSLLFAWAYAESLYDVRSLLAGRRVPIMKSMETWHFSLEGMLHYEEQLSPAAAPDDMQTGSAFGGTLKDGLSYEDYLRLFLTVKNRQTKRFKMMDIVEMDLRRTEGNECFRLDNCCDYMTLSACVGSRTGCYHEMERTFYYQ